LRPRPALRLPPPKAKAPSYRPRSRCWRRFRRNREPFRMSTRRLKPKVEAPRRTAPPLRAVVPRWIVLNRGMFLQLRPPPQNLERQLARPGSGRAFHRSKRAETTMRRRAALRPGMPRLRLKRLAPRAAAALRWPRSSFIPKRQPPNCPFPQTADQKTGQRTGQRTGQKTGLRGVPSSPVSSNLSAFLKTLFVHWPA